MKLQRPVLRELVSGSPAVLPESALRRRAWMKSATGWTMSVRCRAVRAILCCLGAMLCLGAITAQAASDGSPGAGPWIAEFVWAPQFCRDHANERNSEACNAAYGLVLRRLRAQTNKTCGGELDDAVVDAATRAVVSPRWVKEMWQHDGRCSGATAAKYFEVVTRVINAIEMPAGLREAASRPIPLAGGQIESALLALNRSLHPEDLMLHCDRTMLTQVDFCLAQDLKPSACPLKKAKACGERIDLLEKK